MKRQKVPMRMCIGCKQMKPKRELLRIVLPKEGEMAVDESGKQNGRGAYLCADEQCLALAKKQKAVRLSAQTLQTLEEAVQKRIDG